MNRYLLPCSCSCRIAVTPGQAGGVVHCPACSAAVAVPRLGELGRLERDAGPANARAAGGWRTAHACALAGVILAVLAGGTAVWLGRSRGGLATVEERAFLAAAESATADQIHGSWLDLEARGIDRPPLAAERRRQAYADSLGGLEVVAWIVAAAAAAVAAAAIIVATGRRGSGERRA